MKIKNIFGRRLLMHKNAALKEFYMKDILNVLSVQINLSGWNPIENLWGLIKTTIKNKHKNKAET